MASSLFQGVAVEAPIVPDFENWVAYSTDRFLIKTPVKPLSTNEIFTDPVTSELRRYGIHIAERSGGFIFMITVIDFPEGMKTSKGLIIEGLKNGMITAKQSNRLIADRMLQFKGYEAEEIQIENPEELAYHRLFFVGDVLYMLSEIGPKNRFNPAEFEHFVNSFQVK